MSSSVLLYALLIFWVLPAIVLIGLYVYELIRDVMGAFFCGAWEKPRDRRTTPETLPTIQARNASGEDSPIVESTRMTHETPAESGALSLKADTQAQVLVPLLVEDGDGNVYMCQWELCLN